MKVGAIVHMYPPTHNAGAEWMLHHILRYLNRQGHTTSAWVSKHDRFSEYQGVMITGPRSEKPERYAERHDIILTHLDETLTALHATTAADRPLVHLVHNHRQLSYNGITPKTAPLVVFNSKWLCKTVGWGGPQVIVRPPVPPADYRTNVGHERRFITQINLSGEKGAETFYALARRRPQWPFIGVLGAYGYQVRENLPNVLLRVSTPRLRPVYAQTRILLMPSSYESWGRVAIEAAWSRIPTLYHPTPGLTESVGVNGFAIDRNDLDLYEETITWLEDPAVYAAAGSEAFEMAEQHWKASRRELAALAQRLEELCR